ncbi:hypothetical protein Q5Y75_20605 [Ruegeria sp. 2205SS24-7]|uniref:hypothetical protein n=1 Tax=Ruegeria discodermiae TaxID=3064389 RepID=UPI002741AE16|nr:hypothetical protein [Ruegeria sp. 2205SS24-7]MDP5219629.1 hypothetical protein [Ruegeria sp. 2205SS24-7]
MLTVFAKSFMTATRVKQPTIRDYPAPKAKPRRRWLPEGHWWLQTSRDVDLNDL